MEIKLDKEQISNIVGLMLASRGRTSKADLAREIGIKETTFRAALSNESLRFKDFLQIAETLGFEIVAKKKEQEG
ncbi:hypothetical protein ACIFOE_04660 [Paenibacillus sp. NRS-1783]|uniref:hypothetical protein n=1 Tax=Paenibacillus sp. NRS-1783 TaxID=3233907 RepID=UPI003D28DCB3